MLLLLEDPFFCFKECITQDTGSYLTLCAKSVYIRVTLPFRMILSAVQYSLKKNLSSD